MLHPAFISIIGHEAVCEFLSRALSQDRLAHAYLFVGPEGVGKSAVTEALFAAFLEVTVSQLSSHSDTCFVRRQTDQKTGKEKTLISVEQIRDVVERMALSSFSGRKAVWIEEADRLNVGAANAFLKTLEEPSGKTLIVLSAEHLDGVPATLVSRCQIVRFRPTPPERLPQATLEEISTLFQADIPTRLRWAAAELPKEEVNKATVALSRLDMLERAAREQLLFQLQTSSGKAHAWTPGLHAISEARESVLQNGHPQLALEHALLAF